ncbi:arginine deiminase-related protein [Aliikangiella maris]|uniref:Arginine deiminase-related protein n=2 Tax=Aliikangiella maris TaxID=3162458 RepID=A0ABV3MQQ1_9GAMM
MMFNQPQLTHSIIMVKPIDFGFNEQTGQDNEYQQRPTQLTNKQVRQQALEEFQQMQQHLQDKGVEIITLGKPQNSGPLPDAVFPNNWFSTQADGKLIIYPMKTPNRQDEVQIDNLSNALKQRGYQISQQVDLRLNNPAHKALEGTGSLVFHHPSRQVFAALSERCDAHLLNQFATQFDYQPVAFETQSCRGNPIYHTNVMMSCGQHFCLVTKEIIQTSKQSLFKQLEATFDDVIIISEAQMGQNFCGNIIQLRSKSQSPLIVMSSSAFKGFEKAQQQQLEKHGELVICSIDTIEKIGGGSARCMIAENFLPLQNRI